MSMIQADGLPLPSTWRPLRLQTLVLLRWLAVGGQTIGVLFVALGLGFPLPLLECLALIALSAAVNLWLVLHFGANEWDGPLSLHEMMAVKNKNLLNFVQDYQIHLIDPAKLSAEDLERFSSSLREVIGYIKYSKDKKRLSEFLTDNPRMLIEANAARVIKAVTNTPLDIPEGAEVIDVCKAVEEMMNESEERGELRMLVQLVRDGDLKLERAAEKAKMTVEQFEKVMENTPLQAV